MPGVPLGGFYIDPLYLIIAVISLVISGAAQLFVSSAYRRWGAERNGAGISGVQVAERIFQRTNVAPIRLEGTPGRLTDHFDPGKNVVRLSEDVATRPSVASMAIVAHELGHVQQYQERSALIAARSFLLPAVRFSPILSYMLILFGFLLQITGLIWAGVVVFGLMVLFSVLTLPVEIDASRRALRLLDQTGLMVTAEDRSGARAVLTAAALTYVAAAVTAVLQLLYYITLAQRSSRS